jgi:hypothetical protein
MNLVRAALIGLALGLLAIGLPGSEETLKRQSAGRIAVYAPRSCPTPEPSLAAVEAPRVYQPMPPAPPPQVCHVAPPTVCQVAPPAIPAASVDTYADEPAPSVEPPIEDPVPLAAMNRPLSLDLADLPAADRLTKVLASSEPAAPATPSVKTETPLRKTASAGNPLWDRSDRQTGVFEQAEVRLTKVLTRRNEPDAEVTVKRTNSSMGLR